MWRAYIAGMKRIVPILAIALMTALPAGAQDTPEAAPPDSSEDSGLSLIERGAKMFLEGLMQEVEPTVKDLRGMAENMQPALRDFAERMGPAFADILGQIGDLSAYHAPEILPNGDIIMRKKTPQELLDDAVPEGEIEI